MKTATYHPKNTADWYSISTNYIQKEKLCANRTI